MKLATFNANSIRSRQEIVTDWLQEHDVDVLCIQETKVVDELFPAEPFEALGYNLVFRGQKSYNGVAIMSKEEPEEVQAGFDDGGQADETRFLRCRIGDVTVINTYVPQGRDIEHEMFQYKLEWYKRLRDYFDRHFTPEDLVIWTGDLNVALHPMDVHNPKTRKKHVCFHDDVRRALATTMEWGFVDVFRQFHPEEGHFTFFDYRTVDAAKLGKGWRIDYILASEALAACSVDSYIDVEPRLKEKPSDHTFLVAEFELD